jgi:hypothetical protein
LRRSSARAESASSARLRLLPLFLRDRQLDVKSEFRLSPKLKKWRWGRSPWEPSTTLTLASESTQDTGVPHRESWSLAHCVAGRGLLAAVIHRRRASATSLSTVSSGHYPTGGTRPFTFDRIAVHAEAAKNCTFEISFNKCLEQRDKQARGSGGAGLVHSEGPPDLLQWASPCALASACACDAASAPRAGSQMTR